MLRRRQRVRQWEGRGAEVEITSKGRGHTGPACLRETVCRLQRKETHDTQWEKGSQSDDVGHGAGCQSVTGAEGSVNVRCDNRSYLSDLFQPFGELHLRISSPPRAREHENMQEHTYTRRGTGTRCGEQGTLIQNCCKPVLEQMNLFRPCLKHLKAP